MNTFLFPGAEKIQAAYRQMIHSGQLNEESLRACIAQQMLDIGINLAGSCYADARSNMVPPYPGGEKPPGFFNLPIAERLAHAGAFIAAEMDRIELEQAAALTLEQSGAHLTGEPSDEERVVGWLLQNGQDIVNCAKVCTAMQSRQFSPDDTDVALVFQCCLQLIDQSQPCGIAEVQASLIEAQYLDNAGGPIRLMEMGSNAATPDKVIEILSPPKAAPPASPIPAAAPTMNIPTPTSPASAIPAGHVEQAAINPALMSNEQLQQLVTMASKQLITNADGGSQFLPVVEENGQRFVMAHTGPVIAPTPTPPPQPRPPDPQMPEFPDWLAGGGGGGFPGG